MGAETLRRLTRWYASQCDGDWEHQEGVTIESLDNPGWRVQINLVGTALADVPCPVTEDAYEHKTDWMRCWRTESSWEGACGPRGLEDVLDAFLEWAEQSESPRQPAN